MSLICPSPHSHHAVSEAISANFRRFLTMNFSRTDKHEFKPDPICLSLHCHNPSTKLPPPQFGWNPKETNESFSYQKLNSFSAQELPNYALKPNFEGDLCPGVSDDPPRLPVKESRIPPGSHFRRSIAEVGTESGSFSVPWLLWVHKWKKWQGDH